VTLAQSDLTYATGKMDTASVQGWLTAASSQIAKAKDAQTNQQYGQAAGYAQAAQALVQTAEQAMAQELGASVLPSYSQQPQLGGRHGMTDSTQTPTQAQTSRDLQRTYNQIVSQSAVIGGNAEAGTYLTQAQAAYKTAYDAYQAGNYEAAHDASHLASSLLRVAESLVRAAGAPANADTPVTVPAPNF
jgi:HEPN domain-containing protein